MRRPCSRRLPSDFGSNGCASSIWAGISMNSRWYEECRKGSSTAGRRDGCLSPPRSSGEISSPTSTGCFADTVTREGRPILVIERDDHRKQNSAYGSSLAFANQFNLVPLVQWAERLSVEQEVAASSPVRHLTIETNLTLCPKNKLCRRGAPAFRIRTTTHLDSVQSDSINGGPRRCDP